MKQSNPFHILVSALIILTLLLGAVPLQTALAQVGGPGGPSPSCTPDSTTGATCPEEEQPDLSAAPTIFPTPTPFGFRLPPPPEENPFRPTPFGFRNPATPTPPLPLANPDNPNLDLEVWAIEVTQGLQDLENRMPLVAERGTVIRVYVRSKSGTIYGIRGMMQITQNGKVAGVVHSYNQPIAAYENGGDRLELNHTLNFYVPIDTRKGDVTYKVFAYPVNTNFPFQYEITPENNFFEVDVEYQPGSSVTIVMPSIHMHDYDEKKIFIETTKDYKFDVNAIRIGMDLMRFYPVVDVEIVSDIVKIYPNIPHGPVHEGDWTFINNGSAPSEILAKIQAYRDEENGNYKDDFWYGMLDPSLPWWWNILDDEGNKTFDEEGNERKFFATGMSNGTVAIGLMLTNFDKNSPWWVEGGVTAAHEGGHNYGLGHYLCAGSEPLGGSVDPNYPYPEDTTDDGDPDDNSDNVVNCSIAAVDPEGFYGFDWYYHNWPHLIEPTVISNDPAEATPNRGFPLMGYRRPQYVDVYTYCTLLNEFGVPCSLGDLGVTYIPDSIKLASLNNLPFQHGEDGEYPEYLQGASEFIRVYGVIDYLNDSASFIEVIRTDFLTDTQVESVITHAGHVHHAEEEGLSTTYTLTLDDANGMTLFSLPIYNTESPHDQAIGQSVSEVAPFLPETKYIRIRDNGNILAERIVSNNSPRVVINTQNSGEQLILPVTISWYGVDPDGDKLTYMLQYSHDGGQTWKPLLKDITTTGVILESFDGMPGSDNGLFRVIANDGVNTGSDTTDTTFSIPDRGPSTLIFTPINAIALPQGSAAYFTGQSIDLEDGSLSGESLVWSSDLDGVLGNGKEVIVYTLSPGVHEIKLTGTDSKGQAGEAIVYVNVDPNSVIELPSQQEINEATAILNGDWPEQANPGPETDSSGQAQPEAESPPTEAESTLPVGLLVGIGAVLLLVVGFFILRGRNK